ncbi:hypothetical protein CKALI_07725 [Corynebacterium kalinowskii]|uniref:Uncharacterized protein n=1 Tax=Corynebacterium kalinowskii TaxID=2675216 RepID=A0A6B8VS04_9CORY|nr:hypothetical protein [Corynebacterium kalinowskii]QGU02407.1 hypothetical protein CKALI_07725 [Corynebacterium kalinowskii]
MVEEQRGFVYTDHSVGEIAFGFLWLGLGALMSVLLEVVYLGTWITLPGGGRVAFPYPILIALLFNMVLTKTARLWTDRVGVVLIPLAVWLLGFCALTFWVGFTGDILVGSNPRSLVLLAAGLAGGLWPLTKPKVAQ